MVRNTTDCHVRPPEWLFPFQLHHLLLLLSQILHFRQLLSHPVVSCLPIHPEVLHLMFVTGPYAHETQLVSPPVYSTFTIESSTAPLTPPPELAHLTAPSSPDVPYARFLSSSANFRSTNKTSYVAAKGVEAVKRQDDLATPRLSKAGLNHDNVMHSGVSGSDNSLEGFGRGGQHV